MRRLVDLCLLGVALAGPTQSQDSSIADRARERAWLSGGDASRMDTAEDLRRLHRSMNEFVRAWNVFALEYTERGTWNVKKAREVRRAWQALERENAWPR